jgi:hypothetical protein
MSPSPHIDTSKPHPARVYDFLLGGKDNYLVDQELAEQMPEFFPIGARQNRAFMQRAVAWLAGQGIDQYLDVGTGIPTEPNLHQIAQRIVPTARIVYVDNDPIVLRHAEALLVSSPGGVTDYIEADAREPVGILDHARSLLDFDRPIALSLVALLHFIVDDQDPYGVVRTLVDALPSGSYLVLSHSCLDDFPEYAAQVRSTYGSRINYQSRSLEAITRFFDGLDLVEPGVVPTGEWYQGEPTETQEPSSVYVGVARVP